MIQNECLICFRCFFVVFSGGAGYVMSIAAIQLIGPRLAWCRQLSRSTCDTHPTGVHPLCLEDTAIGMCFHNVSVEPFNSRDSQDRERFHVLEPARMVSLDPHSM